MITVSQQGVVKLFVPFGHGVGDVVNSAVGRYAAATNAVVSETMFHFRQRRRMTV